MERLPSFKVNIKNYVLTLTVFLHPAPHVVDSVKMIQYIVKYLGLAA